MKNRTHEVVTTHFSHYIISYETELAKKGSSNIKRKAECRKTCACAFSCMGDVLKNKKCAQHAGFFGTCVHTNYLVKRFVFFIGSIDI